MSADPVASAEPGPWPARAAFASAVCAVPLVLFGGSVTTLGAGMAVDGWLVAEGHFLLFFPLEKWFRDTATFVEHTHRLFGILVGLSALACAALAFVRGNTRLARGGALVALLAVCVQGALGGLRVLADDPGLAFVHGALAQLVFAVLCANAVLFTREWRAPVSARLPRSDVRALASAAVVALVVLYAQVVLGAWYRHGLRPLPVAGHELRFALHGAGALLVLASAAGLARRGAALRATGAELPLGLVRALRRVPLLLFAQLVLGGLAWAGFRPGAIGPAEWGLSIAHVLGGALLLADVTVVALWAAHLRAGLARTAGESAADGNALLGEAR
jgi:cytochrome c oxidase assembly protein subunit 15